MKLPPSRRLVLRGAGGASIALPFLLSRQGDTKAAPAAPRRLFTLYFGEGLPAELTASGLDGPLASLAPFASKLAMVRGLKSHVDAPGSGHTQGSAAFACARDTTSASSKGGPSLDWVAQQAVAPATRFPVLSTGVYGGYFKDQTLRVVHSWRGAGKPNDPITDTLTLFETLFGRPERSPETRKRARLKASVLDVVMEDLRSLTSEASPHAPSVRALIKDHAEIVRDMEVRAIEESRRLEAPGEPIPAACDPARPEPLEAKSPATFPNYERVWPVLTDLLVTAMRCDLVRFGSVTLLGGGEEIGAKTPYGTVRNIHTDVFHRWPGEKTDVFKWVVSWTMDRIAAFLAKLDDPGYLTPGGGTLLDGTAVLIGTELGNPSTHQRDDMTFFLAGRSDRIRPGVHDFPARSDVDLYNTTLRALGVDHPFGDQRHFTGLLPITKG